MFSPGQLVYVKVIDKSYGEKEEILLSLLPQDINSEITAGMLEKGNILLCGVQEIEDHGYLMETGVKQNINAFLPKKNVKGTPAIGDLMFCCVEKKSALSITLMAIKKNEGLKLNTDDVPNLKTLVPGSIVTFSVTRALKNGLEGLLFDGSVTALCNDMYLPRNVSPSDISIIGKDFKARVLYTVPLSNQIMLTLNFSEQKPQEILEFGKLISNAKVIRQTSGGILFKLHDKARGFLPKNSIVKGFKNNFDMDSTLIKFAPNSEHSVRVMSYNQIEDSYVITNDEKLLAEKYFCTSDLKIGEIVTVKIREKLTKGFGFSVSIGNLKAFLRGVLIHPTSKLEEGQAVKVRVVENDAETKIIDVTNHPGFLKESANLLLDLNNIRGKEYYAGLVMKEGPKTFTVLFLNHIKGIFNKTENNMNELTAFGGLKVGQIKNFAIEKTMKDMVFLKVPKKAEGSNLGKTMEAKITALHSSGAQIHLEDLKMYGKISIASLSEFPEIATSIFTHLKEGDKIQVVGLLNNQWSRRDINYFKRKPKTDFKDVIPGDILRCFVNKIHNDLVYLECPLLNFEESISLSKNSFTNADDREFQIGEIVYVQVIAKNEGQKNSLYVTPSLHKVWNNEMNVALEMIENYLEDIEFLLKKMKDNGKPIGNLKLGQKVSGKIVNLLGNKLLIELEDQIFAQAIVENVRAYHNGNNISGTIVWIDPTQQIVHLTVNEKCCKEISESQKTSKDYVNEKKHKSMIIFSNDFLTVCSLKQPNQPLVFTPSRFHYNDYSPIVQKELGGASSKLVIKKRTESKKLLGIFASDLKICQKIDKYQEKITKIVKRKAAEFTQDNETAGNKKKKTVDDSSSDSDTNEDGRSESVKTTKPEDSMVSTKTNPSTTTTFTRIESFRSKSKRVIGKKLTNSFRKKSKPNSFNQKGNMLKQNKDSLLNDNIVDLVSFKKIKEDLVEKPAVTDEKQRNKKKIVLKKKSGSILGKSLKIKKKKRLSKA